MHRGLLQRENNSMKTHRRECVPSPGGCHSKLSGVAICHLYCVFTYIYSFLMDKDLCESSNVSIKFPCALLVHLCFRPETFFW